VIVEVTTTGEDLDDGYTVSIGSLGGTVSANGSVTVAAVPVGSRSVQLAGIAANCSVTGSNPASVDVVADQAATVSFAVACAAIQVQDANTLIDQAIDSLEAALLVALNIDGVAGLDDFSFEPAHSLFVEALALSPSNDTASFGAGITTIFMLEDDSRVRAIAEDLDAWLEEDAISPLLQTLLRPAAGTLLTPGSLPLGFSTTQVEQVAYSGLSVAGLTDVPLPSDDPPPSITEAQAVLREVVRPALIEALDDLAEIENPDFTFTVTEAMQGESEAEADPLELDFTEILALRAGFHVAIAATEVATAYTLTPSPLTATGFVDALTPGSTFLTLASGGEDDLEDALTRLRAAADILLDGLDELESETDDQSDDIIKYDPTGSADGLTSDEIDEARGLIEDIAAALVGPAAVTVNEGGSDEVTFTVDAQEFFVDPIADFKALLPGYEVFTAMEEGETTPVFRWTDLNIDDWMFPDPTFSGVFPGMTTPGLFDLEFDEVFFEFSLTGGYFVLISVDGLDCRADYQSGGNGCPVDGDFYTGGSINLRGNDGVSEAWVDLVSSYALSAYGTYAVADNSGGTYTVSMDTTLQDGTGTPLPLTGLFTDLPGYSTTDGYFRSRGGSTIEVSYLGSTWIFEKQF
jgi:hypothetical protein